MITSDEKERLQDIQAEMIGLLDEAQSILRRAEGSTYARAESYWIAHIKMALTKNHEYLGGSMCTMEDTINELEGEEELYICPNCGSDCSGECSSANHNAHLY